jgi:hypothetical protein
MKTLVPAEADLFNNSEPWTQVELLGSRLLEVAQGSEYTFKQTIAAGTSGVVTPLVLPTSPNWVNQGAPNGARPDVLFDFEVLDVLVRTETTVASSSAQLKAGATALSDAIVSATANALTRAGTIDPTKSQFLPLSNPAAYAAAPLNIVDAGGATAAKRTVFIKVRRL